MVKEALEYVHEALQDNKIVSVSFAWVKYLVTWSTSGPGYYAGIRVALNGEWHKNVVQCQSAR